MIVFWAKEAMSFSPPLPPNRFILPPLILQHGAVHIAKGIYFKGSDKAQFHQASMEVRSHDIYDRSIATGPIPGPRIGQPPRGMNGNRIDEPHLQQEGGLGGVGQFSQKSGRLGQPNTDHDHLLVFDLPCSNDRHDLLRRIPFQLTCFPLYKTT